MTLNGSTFMRIFAHAFREDWNAWNCLWLEMRSSEHRRPKDNKSKGIGDSEVGN